MTSEIRNGEWRGASTSSGIYTDTRGSRRVGKTVFERYFRAALGRE